MTKEGLISLPKCLRQARDNFIIFYKNVYLPGILRSSHTLCDRSIPSAPYNGGVPSKTTISKEQTKKTSRK